MIRKYFFLLLTTMLAFPAVISAQTGPILVEAPGNRHLKLAVESPHTLDATPNVGGAKEINAVIAFDMNMSGAVTAETQEQLPIPGDITLAEVDYTPWLAGGYDLLVRSQYSIKGDDLTVEFRLYDVLNKNMMTAQRYLGKTKNLRYLAHSFADEIMLTLTGKKGCFTTHIAFVSTQTGNKEIFIMDWDGHTPLALTRNGSINLNPDFSPDGKDIIYTSYQRGNPDLFKRALADTTEEPISTHRGLNITGTWSPDGSRIALARSKGEDTEIYTIAKDGSNPVRLTSDPSINISPSWSPDGSSLAFVSDRLGRPQIFIMKLSDRSTTLLTTPDAFNVTPCWSPKGDKIVYVRMQGGEFQIHSINADGSVDTQLTSVGRNENPAWSPDGRFITFSSNQGGVEAIYVMRSDGSGQTRVSQTRGRATQPAWSSR